MARIGEITKWLSGRNRKRSASPCQELPGAAYAPFERTGLSILAGTGGEFKNNPRFELEVVLFQGWKIGFATSIRKDGEPAIDVSRHR